MFRTSKIVHEEGPAHSRLCMSFAAHIHAHPHKYFCTGILAPTWPHLVHTACMLITLSAYRVHVDRYWTPSIVHVLIHTHAGGAVHWSWAECRQPCYRPSKSGLYQLQTECNLEDAVLADCCQLGASLVLAPVCVCVCSDLCYFVCLFACCCQEASRVGMLNGAGLCNVCFWENGK